MNSPRLRKVVSATSQLLVRSLSRPIISGAGGAGQCPAPPHFRRALVGCRHDLADRHRRHPDRLRHLLPAARRTGRHLGSRAHDRRSAGRTLGAGLVRRAARRTHGGAHRRAGARPAALQRRGPHRPAGAAPPARLAGTSPADRAAAHDGGRHARRTGRLSGPFAFVGGAAGRHAVVDRRRPGPARGHRHLRAGPRTAGAERGERLERRPRRAVLPRPGRHQPGAPALPTSGGRGRAGGGPDRLGIGRRSRRSGSPAERSCAGPTGAAGWRARGGRRSRWRRRSSPTPRPRRSAAAASSPPSSAARPSGGRPAPETRGSCSSPRTPADCSPPSPGSGSALSRSASRSAC